MSRTSRSQICGDGKTFPGSGLRGISKSSSDPNMCVGSVCIKY